MTEEGTRMKISFSTLGCPEWSFEQIIKSAREMGYEAVELRGVGNQLRMEELECLRTENRGALKSPRVCHFFKTIKSKSY